MVLVQGNIWSVFHVGRYALWWWWWWYVEIQLQKVVLGRSLSTPFCRERTKVISESNVSLSGLDGTKTGAN